MERRKDRFGKRAAEIFKPKMGLHEAVNATHLSGRLNGKETRPRGARERKKMEAERKRKHRERERERESATVMLTALKRRPQRGPWLKLVSLLVAASVKDVQRESPAAGAVAFAPRLPERAG
jgi:hypothetical protein